MRRDRISVFTLVTCSHEALLRDWFLRTMPRDCEPIVYRVDAPPVVYGEGQWHRVVAHKFEILERAFATEPPGAIFVMSDVDVRFYQPFSTEVRRDIEGYDVLFQNNRPGVAHDPQHICTGFMVIRCCSAACAFFERARSILDAADNPRMGDQRSCIQALGEQRQLRFGFLPDTYWTPVRTGILWEPCHPLTPPVDLILHHANKTIGIANKVAQLSAVERLIHPEERVVRRGT